MDAKMKHFSQTYAVQRHDFETLEGACYLLRMHAKETGDEETRIATLRFLELMGRILPEQQPTWPRPAA